MKIATFHHAGVRQVGLLDADGSHLRAFAADQIDASQGAMALVRLLSSGAACPEPAGPTLALAEVKLEAPLPVPRRNIICVGRNYHAHARELRDSVFKNNQPESWPIIFTKVPETVIGPGDTVRLPGAAVSTQIDYEAELTVIIGKGGRNIQPEDAFAHVFGYTIINDVTARDVQMRHAQWYLGKSFDTFCPMGPWIVTADELDGANTRVRCWVSPAGGMPELRQDAMTTDLIFDLPTLIATCSRGITLYPGDIIATGTPAGVGMGMNPQRWLSAGDEVTIEIDGIGRLTNRFADEVTV